MLRLTLVTLSLLTLVAPAPGQGYQKKFRPKNVVPERARFQVYAGFCSRSMGLRGTFTSASEACRKAAEYHAKKLRVEVSTFTGDCPVSSGGVIGYRVYLNTCKDNWRLLTTTKCPAPAPRPIDAVMPT